MSVLTVQWILSRPVLFCTILFLREVVVKFEDAMLVTGLEDVPDGVSTWGVNSEQCKE